MKHWLSLLALLMLALPAQAQDVEVEVPQVVLQGTPFEVVVAGAALDTARAYRVRAGEQLAALAYDAEADAFVAGDVRLAEGGVATVEVVQGGAVVAQAETRAIAGWLSILPPLLAIGMALLFRRVLPALFLGVWLGAWIAFGLTFGGLWQGLLDAFGVYVLDALVDPGNASIVLFWLMIGGMVGVISKNGGMHGIVQWVVRWASDARRGQVSTAVLGIVIFFDDYANTLIVGNTMRPVTDKLRISREKLAYLVDSTAAPVASLALVPTWIGFEVGLINEALDTLPALQDLSGYGVFLESILYRFYPWMALFFVFAIALTDREFGPMLKAERRARSGGGVLHPDANVDEAAGGEELAPKAGKPQRAMNAVIPVCVLVFGTLFFLYTTGIEAARELLAAGEIEEITLRTIIGEADSYLSLMWASLLSAVTAIVLSVGQRILTLEESVEAWYEGLKFMLFAMLVLVLAWALSGITGVLHTAEFLGAVLSEALPAGLVPAIIFVLAAAIAFSTGTSWGTMAILMPLVVPLTWQVMQADGIADPAHYYLLYNAVSCVLAGAVWGDHCSPISDTTILSSMASGCDHIAHVNTQLPYALTVGLVAIALGTIPTGFGFPWWLSMLVSAVLLIAILRFYGRPLDVEEAPAETPERQAARVA